MRKLAKLTVAILAGLTAWYGWMFWENNRGASAVDGAQLSSSLERAIDWLEKNNATIGKTSNDVLFWMLKEAAEASDNPRLMPFRQEYLDHRASPLFDPSYSGPVPAIQSLGHLPYYNLLYLYGSTCNRQLGSEPIVQRQLDPQFCTWHFFRPRCVTHQLLGVRLMQRNYCGDAEEVANLMQQLQDTIVAELTWDPRVGDAYMQRILLLVESGAAQRVKPVWIQRVLQAQNSDGGWGDLDPLVRLPNGRAFGFSSTLPKVGPLRSNFHATAQGVWLLSLLGRSDAGL